MPKFTKLHWGRKTHGTELDGDGVFILHWGPDGTATNLKSSSNKLHNVTSDARKTSSYGLSV